MLCPTCETEHEDTADTCLSCGQPLDVPRAPITRGAIVAERYEILSPLGRGGMGAVYRARDRVLDEDVALKVLRPDLARKRDAARRFRSEIKLARKVRHENVCGIHEYGEQGGLRYIAMELIEGIDLRSVLRDRGRLPRGDAFKVILEVARGLQAIHEVGVIHRDLKPANIMLDRRGSVRLMDFGIAKQYGSDATVRGTVLGTPQYMSPEQAAGKGVDFRADIYTLGIVIFEIFTGRPPFRSDTPMGTILMQIEEPPPLDSAAAATIPPALKAVLGKALEKDPDQRPRTASEMLEALRAASDQDAESREPEESVLAGLATMIDMATRVETEPTPAPPASPDAAPTRIVASTVVPGSTELVAPARRAPQRPGRLTALFLTGAGLLILGVLAFREGPLSSSSGARVTVTTLPPPTTAPASPPVLPTKLEEGSADPAPTRVTTTPETQRPRPTAKPTVAPTPSPTPAPSPPPTPTPAPTASSPLVGSPPAEVPAVSARAERSGEPAREAGAPVPLPASARPPTPDPRNPLPTYPPGLRDRGVESDVFLKVVISETGVVTDVQVLSGDEPFTSFAVEAVASWRYSPALVDGQPTAVVFVVKIPFRATN